MTIREHMQDQVERDYNLLRPYIDTDDATDLAICAFLMVAYPVDSEKYQSAQESVSRIFDAVFDNYCDMNEGEAQQEYRDYLADMEADRKMEAQRE